MGALAAGIAAGLAALGAGLVYHRSYVEQLTV